MEKIKRFFECLIPETLCNMRCSYCYVIQRDNRKNKLAELKYSPSQIGKALNLDRLGGVCYFSICGSGETTMQPELDEIVYNILAQGHYVNITTNGSYKAGIKKILEKVGQYAERMHFAFSFHYLELLRIHKLDEFFENVNMVRNAGASYMVQFNMCDEYVPYLEEIRNVCSQNIGAAPQIAATREEDTGLKKIRLMTKYSAQEYHDLGNSFESPLFDFTLKNFNVRRKEFCYAGDWSGILDLSTGIMRRCYSSYVYQDIFKDPGEPIRFLAVGHFCGSPFCMNSSHFMSLGVIPCIDTPTYAELRERRDSNWYSDDMHEFLSTKLTESNNEYSNSKKLNSFIVGAADSVIRFIRRKSKRLAFGGSDDVSEKDISNGNKF